MKGINLPISKHRHHDDDNLVKYQNDTATCYSMAYSYICIHTMRNVKEKKKWRGEKKQSRRFHRSNIFFFFILMGFVCYSMPLCDKKREKEENSLLFFLLCNFLFKSVGDLWGLSACLHNLGLLVWSSDGQLVRAVQNTFWSLKCAEDTDLKNQIKFNDADNCPKLYIMTVALGTWPPLGLPLIDVSALVEVKVSRLVMTSHINCAISPCIPSNSLYIFVIFKYSIEPRKKVTSWR